jgi:urease gamma subunit
MNLDLEIASNLPPEFLVTVEVDGDAWEQADEDGRNDIVADALQEAVLQMIEDDRLQLKAVFIDGKEYVEED